ncbi:SDR family NAD(P)-dependent oxidoreductase [Streptomyces sp. NPDC055078]
MPTAFRQGGSYLVTGGAGGIGRSLAAYLLERYAARVALLGRSPDDCAGLRATARGRGGDLVYIRADVTDATALDAAVATARERFGRLHGVIHAAGVTDDAPLRDQTEDRFRRVLAPKAVGAVLLDRATADDDLDFLVMFSSVVGTLGNAGQAGYAAANRFLDAFARQRDAAVARGERGGRSLSIAWPFWADGGMRMPDAARRLAATALGLRPIGTPAALRALEYALGLGEPVVLVGHGDRERIGAALARSSGTPVESKGTASVGTASVGTASVGVAPTTVDLTPTSVAPTSVTPTSVTPTSVATPTASAPDRFVSCVPGAAVPSDRAAGRAEQLGHAERAGHAEGAGQAAGAATAALRERLRTEAGALAGIAPERIDPGTELGGYGFNSLLFTDFAGRLNQLFGLALTPVVFFENPTVDALTAMLLDRHGPAVNAAPADASAPAPVAEPQGVPVPASGTVPPVVSFPVPASVPPTAAVPAPVAEPTNASAPVPGVAPSAASAPAPATDAGRRAGPGAALGPALAGDGIRPGAPVAVIGMAGRFPGSRDVDSLWEHLLAGRCLTGPAPVDRLDAARTGRHGGFLDDVTAFDAGFFRISPGEARLMDPQQRLFLETGWHALEDAGYDPRALAGRRAGVFVGASLYDYAELLSHHGEETAAHTVTGTMQSIIANRFSSLLDLRGPSEVVDTACSSSLTALHRAVVALRGGECELAVTGGVNALLSPRWFDSLGDAGMLSATGRCWSFDGRADGFVRSEGVGAVVLKRLDSALADGDTVRAVIRGVAVGHGGRAHSLTAPSPEGQAEVVVSALRDAGVDARTVTYVETHGTGTALGDPVEVAGLRAAFSGPGEDTGRAWCALGAVKSNIGHLEAAAGVAGLVKVVLALRHRTLPPNAAGAVPNPHLELSGSPFSLLTAARPWGPSADADSGPVPLRAGLSSFGFGGANAHVIVEEAPPAEAARDARTPGDRPELFVLSAADPGRLRVYAERVRRFLPGASASLRDIAHTSRTGRTVLPARLAIVATSREELSVLLDSWLDGRAPAGVYAGTTARTTARTTAGEAPGTRAPGTGDLHETARLWVAGRPGGRPAGPGPEARRVPFPTYPFDHSTGHGFAAPPAPPAGDDTVLVPQLLTRHWVPASLPASVPASVPASEGSLPGRPTRLLLVGSELALPLLEALPGRGMEDWVVLREPSPLPRLARYEYELDFDDYAAGRRAAELVVSRHGPVGLVVDLVDAAGGARPAREAARVGVLQVVAAHGRTDGVRWVQLTRGLASPEGPAPGSGPAPGPGSGAGPGAATPGGDGLAGARIAALVRAVGAEYAAVRTTTVDLGGDGDGGPEDAAGQLALAVRELTAAGDEPEVRYRGGVRAVPRFTTVPRPPEERPDRLGGFPVHPDRSYLITGGTGGLGLAVAERLVERGARRIALTGRRPLPVAERPEPGAWWGDRVGAIRRMEAAGAEVMLHHGLLSERSPGPHGLPVFLDRVRSRLGPLAGVLHCAGSAPGNPVFLDKSWAEIAANWEPKGEGLFALDELIADDEPDFVVLFSSVSAVVPALAVGLSDYAGANATLDAFAAYARRRARRRGSRTRYLAVDWGSWTGLGMGEVTSPRYRALGLGALNGHQGLGLLDAALATIGSDGSPTSCVAVAARPGAAGLLGKPGDPPGAAPDPAAHLRPGTTAAAPEPVRNPAPEPVRNQPVRNPAADGPLPGAGNGNGNGPVPETATVGESEAADGLVHRCAALLAGLLARPLRLAPESIRHDAPFADLGVDSILVAGVVTRLESAIGAPVEPASILAYPTVARLARHLVERHAEGVARWVGARPAGPGAPDPGGPPAPVAARGDDPAGPGGRTVPLAVIGMAGRYPGAPTTAEFWDLLRAGRSGVGPVPPSRWDVASLYAPRAASGKSISKWGGFLSGIEDFDAAYFGIAREDAVHLEPLTRLFLECAEETFADAGYARDELAGRRIGVFVGAGTSTYGTRIPEPARATASGLNQNFIGAQLSHVYDLRGPNLVVDTACSSSLTGLYLAQQALQQGECEMALAGGGDLLLDEMPYLRLSAARALSPDGTCHVFDAGANGFVPGEGVGAVLLKPLDRALADGDRVYAVVESVAINNDGRTMGLTTPNLQAQRDVVLDALGKAGADARTVSYVEAHGTGTMIGDPIELRALTQAFGRFTDERGFCAVGSVKSNIGHLLMAAGMASLHKVVLSLRHRMLPPTLHCGEPNPRFAFRESPFYPNVEPADWQPRHGVRRAGISAFGFGGTNCHAVLREVTDAERATGAVRREPLPPPRFRRLRHWAERPRDAAAPYTNGAVAARPVLRPILELGELS